jgi:serine protease Do
MDNNYQNNEQNQQENSYQSGYQDGYQSSYSGSEQSAASEQQPAYMQQQPENNGPEIKKKKKMPVWATRCILGVLICAIAFGGGYAGASLAYQNVDRVVVERVTTTTTADSGSSTTIAASTDSTLSSIEVAAKTEPSVVAIMTEQMTTSSFWYGQQVSSGAGSGIVISEDGYILTCDHVIAGADTIQVQLSDDSVYDAEVIGEYTENDIAVIKIDATGLTPAVIADSDTVVQGEKVYAVGNPEGRFSGSITDGIISAVSRDISMQLTKYNDDEDDSSSNNNAYANNPWASFFGYSSGSSNSETINTVLNVFQTNAAVSPGNSGGGLFNANGELIGVVNAKSSDTDAEGLGFAIPINKAMEIANALITDGSYTPPADETTDTESSETKLTNKAMLGIRAGELTAAQAAQYGLSSAGVYVVEITEQQTEDAGLAVGDRIISVDDTIVSAVTDVTGYLADKEPGDVVTVTVERSGKMLSIDITLLENPDA